MSIVLDNVTISYQRHPAVHHVSGEFACAQATALFGPNGAGKSTLLKAIVGVMSPDAGEIRFLPPLKHKAIAYLPQQSEIDRSFPISVIDLVYSGLWQDIGSFGGVSGMQRARALHALHTVGLADFAHRPIDALSRGQFQRVLFARILLQDAKLILLDEPFNAIDTRTTSQLLTLINRWCVEGRTVVAVLHDLEQVRAFFPKTLLLAREKVAWGDTCDVLTDANLKQAVSIAARWQEGAPVCHIDEIVRA